VAELADALASGASSRKGVEVRVLSWAPYNRKELCNGGQCSTLLAIFVGASSGASWSDRKAFHRLTKMSFAQVRIMQSCLHSFVPHEYLDGPQRHSRHRETACKRMAEIVPAEILNLCLSQHLIEPFPGVARLWPVRSRAHVA
jgi:hypothetical protein